MKSIDITGKNVDEALEKALSQLNVTKEDVKVDIIDEGFKGFLNFIGSKPARIKVTLKRNYKNDAKKFLNKILEKMNKKADICIEEKEDSIFIDLVGTNMGSIIGYRGETLDALQYLVSLVVNKDHDVEYKRVVLDTENYRSKREETLKRVARKTANKVRKSRKTFKLEPMNPYERRIIHSTLQDSKDVITYSEGEEPHRRVVIDVK